MQDDHAEFRMQVTCDLVINEKLYTDRNYFNRSSDGSEDIVCLLSLFTAADFGDTTSLQDFFWSEVMSIHKTEACCGVWQIFSVANIRGCNVCSVYSLLGEVPVHLMITGPSILLQEKPEKP